MGSRQREHRTRRGWILGTFLFFLGLYSLTQSGRFHVIDEYETFFMAQSLLERGELSIPQVEGSSHFFGKRGTDGKPYAPYGVGQPILTLPFLAAGRWLSSHLPIPHPDLDFWLWFSASFSCVVFSALAVALFHLWLLARGVAVGQALLGAMLLGAGTLVWSYAAQYRSNSMVMTLLVSLLVISDRRGVTWTLLQIGLSALAVLVRSDALLGVVLLGAYRVWGSLSRREFPLLIRGLVPFAVGCVTGLAISLMLNALHFGNPLDVGYPPTDDVGRPAYRFGFPDLGATLTLLVSPGKGLLVLSPVLILAIAALPRALLKFRRECLLAVAMTVVYLLFFSGWQHFEGGWCFGPRFLLPVIPFLLIPLVLARLRIAWILVALAIGATINLLAVSVNFLAVARTNDYYLNLENPLEPLSYNFLYNPVWEHAVELLRGLEDLVAGREFLKAPGMGIDFWWSFAAKESIPATVIIAIAAIQALVLLLGVVILRRSRRREDEAPPPAERAAARQEAVPV